MHSIRFIFCLHNHQPVGNFDHVIGESYDLAYGPFLELAARYADFRFCLHTSGCLLEWLETHKPEYLDRLGELVNRGQVELLTGAMYEPILPIWPESHIEGQIARQTAYMERLFGVRPTAFWLPERVWEPQLASVLHHSGVRCLPLDDLMFLSSGLTDDQLSGHYVTEHEGRTLNLFPVPQRLRYTIPFADPAETVAYLRSVAARGPGQVVTYGDDGEKFGSWPETHKHVFENGWLERFIKAILGASDWIEMAHFSEVLDTVPPAGRIYLATGSYREMTEWALPPEPSAQFDTLWHDFEADTETHGLRGFVRGGFWRNFLAKYSEANRLHKAILYFMKRLFNTGQATEAGALAVTHLLRAQCNCPYWHGVFGGLYLPHLRSALYEEIGRARQYVAPRKPHVLVGDHDGDGHADAFLEHPLFDLHLAPARGGQLEMILQHSPAFNWGCTLTRRKEAYHAKLKDSAAHEYGSGGTKSIHDIVRAKEPELEKYLSYDAYERASLIDHFFDSRATLEQFVRAAVSERGDFVGAPYNCTKVGKAGLRLSRSGSVGCPDKPRKLRVEKKIECPAEKATFDVHYEFSADLPEAIFFGVEWNLTALAPAGPERWVQVAGVNAGDPNETSEQAEATSFGLVDLWGKKAIRITADRPFRLWRFGLHTVSLSEYGFEKVYQQTVFLPLFSAEALADHRLAFTVELLEL